LSDVKPRSSVAVRRSSFIVTYWTGGRHCVECYLTHVRRDCDSSLLEILEMANEWASRVRICAALDPDGVRGIATLIEELVGEGFLDSADQPRAPAAKQLDGWSTWNPFASFFHAASAWRSPEPARAAVRAPGGLSLLRPMPPSLKKYANADRTLLPSFARDGELADVLRARRTWRAFGDRPIALQELSILVGATFAVQRWMDVGEREWVALKSSPSGGARHSVEAYVVACRVDGLASGIYHYNPDEHALTTLRGEDPRQLLATAMPTQPYFHDCAALVVMTSVFARMQWKYSHPHAYRVVFLDAGHLSQTFLLTATALGLAPFCTAAIDARVIESSLGIDGVSEAVLHAVGVGAKPTGIEAQVPGEPDAPTREPAWTRARTGGPHSD
jgi:SagB-type dehydrogenase family enzyme